MKSFLLFSVCLYGLIYAEELEPFVDGREVNVNRRSGRVVKNDTEVCAAATETGLYCNGKPIDDCDADAVVGCTVVGDTKEKNSNGFKCGPGRYCHKGELGIASCKSFGPASCIGDSSFVCTSVGVFPDPFDCKTYYFCDKDLKPKTLKCPDLYVFDPSRPSNSYCRLTRNNFCTEADCGTSFKSIVMSYRWYPKSMGTYIAVCQGSETPKMYQCPKGFEPDLSEIPVLCNLVCRGRTRGKDISDATKYFECVNTGSGWVAKSFECGPGETFNGTTLKCV